MSKFLIALSLVGGLSICSAQYLSACNWGAQEVQVSRTSNSEIPTDFSD